MSERMGLPFVTKPSTDTVPFGTLMRLKFGSRSPMMDSQMRSWVAQYFASCARPPPFCVTQVFRLQVPW